MTSIQKIVSDVADVRGPTFQIVSVQTVAALLSKAILLFSQVWIFDRTDQSSVFPGDSVVKNLFANAGDSRLIPRFERSSGEGNGNPF